MSSNVLGTSGRASVWVTWHSVQKYRRGVTSARTCPSRSMTDEAFVAKITGGQAAILKSEVLLFPQPALQLIYDTAPIGLACLSPDCRYLQINQRLTEICGISVEDHLGRSVRECVPALADSVEQIVRSIMPVRSMNEISARTPRNASRAWLKADPGRGRRDFGFQS